VKGKKSPLRTSLPVLQHSQQPQSNPLPVWRIRALLLMTRQRRRQRRTRMLRWTMQRRRRTKLLSNGSNKNTPFKPTRLPLHGLPQNASYSNGK